MRTGTALLHTEELEAATAGAVLFAANFADAAMELLRVRIERSVEPGDDKAWRMLLELYHLTGKRAEFDALAARYRCAFVASAAPAWGYPAAVSVPGMFILKGVVASDRDLAALVQHARTCMTVAIDMSEVQRIDFGFAASFFELLQSFQGQRKRVILANIGELHAALLEVIRTNHDMALLRRKAPHGRSAAAPGVRDELRAPPVARNPMPGALHAASA